MEPSGYSDDNRAEATKTVKVMKQSAQLRKEYQGLDGNSQGAFQTLNKGRGKRQNNETEMLKLNTRLKVG
jgi:hypothetical protein